MNIYILYGSETGNAEGLAKEAGTFFGGKGHQATVKDLGDVSATDLKSFENILIVTSTWGDGEAPSNAEGIYNELQTSTEDLSGTSFGVFAIGSSDYSEFCRTGIEFDAYLSNLGSKRLLDITTADENDGDYSTPFGEWLEKVNKALG